MHVSLTAFEGTFGVHGEGKTPVAGVYRGRGFIVLVEGKTPVAGAYRGRVFVVLIEGEAAIAQPYRQCSFVVLVVQPSIRGCKCFRVDGFTEQRTHDQ